MAYYKAGTIAVATGSDVVIGVGTAWVDNVRVGDMIRLPNGQQHEILARGSDTLLSIFPAYSGPSAEGQPYFVVPVPGYGKKLYDELALAVRQFGDGAEKLENVADGATKNSSDEHLLDRENHTGQQALSTISDAGTSAAANTQTSPTDTTLGAVLTVGAFGIGGYLDMTDRATFKASSPPSAFVGKGHIRGMALASEIGLTNTPGQYGVFSVDSQVPDISVPTAIIRRFEYNNSTWVSRAIGAEQWGAWSLIPVIEYGNNANGSYIKFAGGLLICMPVRRLSTSISNPFGALFRSDPELISFPHEFLNAPSLTLSANDDSAWCNSNNPSGQGVYLYAISPLNRASVHVGCTAIGYWKNPS